jgi:hypothetical protein
LNLPERHCCVSRPADQAWQRVNRQRTPLLANPGSSHNRRTGDPMLLTKSTSRWPHVAGALQPALGLRAWRLSASLPLARRRRWSSLDRCRPDPLMPLGNAVGRFGKCGPADLLPAEPAGNKLTASGCSRHRGQSGHRIERSCPLGPSWTAGRSSRTAHAVLDRRRNVVRHPVRTNGGNADMRSSRRPDRTGSTVAQLRPARRTVHSAHPRDRAGRVGFLRAVWPAG